MVSNRYGAATRVRGFPPLQPFVDVVIGGVGLKLTLAVGARPPSALQGGAWVVAGVPRRGGGQLVRVYPLTAKRVPEGDFLPQMRAPGVSLVSWSKVSSLWRGMLLHSRRTTFASSEPASVRPNTTPLNLSPSSWPCGCACQVRSCARVRSDSLSALWSMVRLSSKPADLNVARELALDAVWGLYTVELATHISGVSNKLPHDLSRIRAPQPQLLPQPLERVSWQQAPDLDRWFWKTAVAKHWSGTLARKPHTVGALKHHKFRALC